MKKILIVDDEKTIRDGLERLIGSANKYDVIGTCKNGLEALNKCKKIQPDIVITDIRMPIMTGLEFIEQYPFEKKPKFIILSGFGEFEYARQAHQLNVFDYVLKPIDHGKLLSVVANAATSVDENSVVIQRKKRELGLLSLQSHISYTKDIANILKDIDIDYTYITPLVFSADNIPFSAEEVLSDLQSYIEEFISSIYTNNIIIVYERRIVVFIYGEQDFDITTLSQLTDAYSKTYSSKLYCAVGNLCSDISGLKKSYDNAINTLSYSLYYPEEFVFTSNNHTSNKNPEIYYYKDKTLVATAIKELEMDTALSYIDLFFEETITKNYPPNALLGYIKEIYTFCYNTVYVFKPDNILTLDINEIILSAKHNVISMEDLKNVLYTVIINTVSTLKENDNTSSNNTVEDVIRYLNINYKDEITLDDIANTFYINKSYFCKVFKETTQTTFNNYLINLRVQKAKNYILEDKYKIYQIAELVGFKDAKYFAKIFKDVVGLTPSEFKQKNMIRTI